MRVQNTKYTLLLSGWYPFAGIALAVLLIYGKVTGFDFINYDELNLIVRNQAFLTDFRSLYNVFFHGIHSHFSHFFRPLLMVSFMIDAHVSGLNPFGYHLSNILFHIVGSWLIYVLFDRLDTGRGRSFVLALIFAVHPVLIPSVAWIPGRNDSLMGIAVFAAFIFLIAYLKQHRIRDLCLHVLFVLAALLIKETALAIIPAGIAYLLLMRENVTGKDWKVLLTAWAMTGIFFFSMQSFAIRYNDLPYRRLFSHLMYMPNALMGYIGKIFFPWNLSVLPSAGDIPVAAGVLATGVISLLLYLSGDKRMNRVWFGALWMVLFYFPTLIINWEGIYYEHRSYVPVAGLFLIVSELRGALWNRMVSEYRYAAGTFITGIFVLLSVIALEYAGTFNDSESFWQNAVTTSPHSFAANSNLAATYTETGKYYQALMRLQAAATIRPDDANTRCYIADQLMLLGRRDDAAREYREALKLDPANRYAENRLNSLNKTK